MKRAQTDAKASELVIDFSLYPRHSVSAHNVHMIAEALRCGVTVASLIVDAKSRRIVDGVHRLRAHVQVNGNNCVVPVEWRRYASEKELVLDAIRLNAAHGERLTPFDVARCTQLGTQFHIEPEELAIALSMTIDSLDKLRARKIVLAPDGTSLAIRRSLHHLAGETLTKKQATAVPLMGGQSLLYCVNQLITAIKYDVLPTDHVVLIDRLGELSELLAMIVPKVRKTA